jgi:hypothetical protein
VQVRLGLGFKDVVGNPPHPMISTTNTRPQVPGDTGGLTVTDVGAAPGPEELCNSPSNDGTETWPLTMGLIRRLNVT